MWSWLPLDFNPFGTNPSLTHSHFWSPTWLLSIWKLCSLHWPLVQVGFEKFKIEFGSYILLLSVSFFLVACFKFWHVHLQVETWTPWVPHDSIGKVPLTEAASQEPSWIDGSHPKCFKHKFQYCVKGRFTW